MKAKLAFFAVWLLCYAIFIYQFVLVTRDYLQYRTITKVEYRISETIELPAFTVAFETPIPMLELWQKAFPNQSYPYKTFSSEGPEFQNSTLGRHCFDVYDSVEKDTWDLENWKRVDDSAVWECFLYYYGNRTVRDYMATMPRHHGRHLTCNSIGDNRSLRCQNVTLCDPKRASYSVGYWGAIGVTLFSKFDSDCLNLTAGGILTVYYKYADILPFKGWYNYVQLHSRNSVPDNSRAQHLDLRRDQTIRYYRILFKRLPPPYDTGCHDYQRAPLNGAISHCDCKASCLFAEMIETTSKGTSFSRFFTTVHGYFVKPKEFPEKAVISEVMKDKHGSKVVNKEWWRKVKKACQAKCPVDCDETVDKWALIDTQREKEGVVMLVLKHELDSDQFYSHLPALDWYSYFGNVGGLAGVWIGFSILSCWSQLYRLGFRISVKVTNYRSKQRSERGRRAF